MDGHHRPRILHSPRAAVLSTSTLGVLRMKRPDTHRLTHEEQTELDNCVKRMRELNCIVIAYSPEDIWNIATCFGSQAWDSNVELSDLASDCNEDDDMWDQLMEFVQKNYATLQEVNNV